MTIISPWLSDLLDKHNFQIYQCTKIVHGKSILLGETSRLNIQDSRVLVDFS